MLKLTISILSFFLIVISYGDINAAENKWLDKNEDEIIESVLRSADKDIDLGCILLVLAKEYYPNIEVKKYLDILDSMAKEIRGQIGSQKEPKDVIQKINDYLFESKGFKTAPTIYWDQRENYDEKALLNKVLDNKSGNCLGLSSLYLALAERLNLPVYGVLSPDHIFIRYDDGKYVRDMETNKNGAELKPSAYDCYLAPLMNKTDELLFFNELTNDDVVFFGYLKSIPKRDVIRMLFVNRGMVYCDKYDYRKAESDWKKAIKISSNPASTHFLIASFLSKFKSVDRDYNIVLSHLNEAIKISPTYYGSYELKGDLLSSRGYPYDIKEELNPVVSLYSKAIELNSSLPRIYYRRGVIYELMGEYDNAIKDIDHAIKLPPLYNKCHLIRAKFLFHKGDNDSALKELGVAIQLDIKYSEAYYFRGLIYKKLGKKQEAIKDFNYYLELDPKSTRTELVQQYIKE